MNKPTKLICPSCGTQKGYAFGTGDCPCDCAYKVTTEEQFTTAFPVLENPFQSKPEPAEELPATVELFAEMDSIIKDCVGLGRHDQEVFFRGLCTGVEAALKSGLNLTHYKSAFNKYAASSGFKEPWK